MENLLGKIKAELIEKEQPFLDKLVDKINENVSPPEQVTADDVYIRAMYIVSDRVNSYGGCFPVDEHQKLTELLIDTPVLVGHRKDSLPVGRAFYAETARRDGVNWVKVYFYWLKSAEKGEDLRKNIDGGIYKECSISFLFNFPECSVCGDDIRRCGHRPFEKYKSNGIEHEAYFNYRRILRVLEVSLVYRGAVQDTSITGKLCFDGCGEDEDKKIQIVGRRLWDISKLDKDHDYLLMPAYEGVEFHLSSNGEGIEICGDRFLAGNEVLQNYLNGIKLPSGKYGVSCRLVGYRGKERRKSSELEKYLKGVKSSVTRIKPIVYDLISYDGEDYRSYTGDIRRERLERIFDSHSDILVKAHAIKGSKLHEGISRYGTRYGCIISDCDKAVNYLYSLRKLIKIKYVKENADEYFIVSCNGEEIKVEGIPVPELNIQSGSFVEIETGGLYKREGKLKLSQASMTDICNIGGLYDDVGLCISGSDRDYTGGMYYLHSVGNNAVLSLNSLNLIFVIHNFNYGSLNNGRRFAADRISTGVLKSSGNFECGDIVSSEKKGEAFRFEFRGRLSGDFVLRPILLNGRERYLFYRSGKKQVKAVG